MGCRGAICDAGLIAHDTASKDPWQPLLVTRVSNRHVLLPKRALYAWIRCRGPCGQSMRSLDVLVLHAIDLSEVGISGGNRVAVAAHGNCCMDGVRGPRPLAKLGSAASMPRRSTGWIIMSIRSNCWTARCASSRPWKRLSAHITSSHVNADVQAGRPVASRSSAWAFSPADPASTAA